MVALRLGRDVSAQLAATQGALVLGRQKVDDATVALLAAALSVNSSVTRVDLRDNQIGDAGAVLLAAHLTNNTAVTEIDLTGNAAIGAVGAEALLALATSNANIVGVEFDANGEMGDDAQQRVAALCQVWGFGFRVSGLGLAICSLFVEG